MNEKRARSRIASPGPHGPYLPAKEIRQWFASAMGHELLLSDDELYDLARLLQLELCGANNAEIDRGRAELSLDGMNEVSQNEWYEKVLGRVAAATESLIEETHVLEKWMGNYTWPSGLTLEDLRAHLQEVRWSSSWRPQISPRGRPPEAWKKPGRAFAKAVSAALKKAGYGGSLRLTYAESAPVRIATDAVNWAYDLRLDTLGFVAGMRDRDRTKLAR
ncbi:MAG: hypothetical protein WDM89_07550 [Rhizomicrobium sp.]